MYSFDADDPAPVHLATLTQPLGGYRRLRAAGDAGLYFSLDYDCGCAPPVERLPVGAIELVPVEGLGGSGGGWYSVAVAGDRLYALRGSDLFRLPLTGGMPEVLGRASGQGQQLLRASERGVCWVAYD